MEIPRNPTVSIFKVTVITLNGKSFYAKNLEIRKQYQYEQSKYNAKENKIPPKPLKFLSLRKGRKPLRAGDDDSAAFFSDRSSCFGEKLM